MRTFYRLWVMVFLAVCVLCVDARAEQEVPVQSSETSSKTFYRMWSAIQRDQKRMDLLFGDFFYVELYSGSPGPVAYKAYIHERVGYEVRNGTRLIVVNRQRFLLPPKGELRDYYSTSGNLVYEELEDVYDENWKLVSLRHWVWEGEVGAEQGEAPRFLYRPSEYEEINIKRGQYTRFGHFTMNRVSDLRFPPFPRAVDLLLAVAADVVQGQAVDWWGDGYVILEEKHTITWSLSPEDPERVWKAESEQREEVSAVAVRVRRLDPPDRLFYPRCYDVTTREFEYQDQQSFFEFRRIDRDTYVKHLREYTGLLDVKEMIDDDGNPVDLPLGLKILEEEEQP